MILTLTISQSFNHVFRDEGGDPWRCVLEIDETATLADLHEAIQDAVRFDNDHLFSFYRAPSEHSGNRDWITDDEDDAYRISVGSLFPLPRNRKLYYLFDFGDNWVFRIAKSRKKPHLPEMGVDYPRLVSEQGERPEQYPGSEEWELDDEVEVEDGSDIFPDGFSEARFEQVMLSSAIAGDSIGHYETYGFLTAVASAPEMIPPSEWLPGLFLSDEVPELEALDDAQQFFTLALQLWSTINDALGKGELYLPAVCKIGEEGEPSEALRSFCIGYVQGNSWVSEDWSEVERLIQKISSNEHSTLANLLGVNAILPLFIAGKDHLMQSRFIDAISHSEQQVLFDETMMEVAQLELTKEEAFHSLREAIIQLGRLGRELSMAKMEAKEEAFRQPYQNPERKVGRNDPCPCGSGKKFKKCCLH